MSDENKTKSSKEILATHQLVEETRTELKSDIASLRADMMSEMKKVDARFNKVDGRFNQMDSRLDKLTSAIEDQNAKFHRSLAIYEEILQQNKYMLDTLSLNNSRLDRIEKILSSPTA